MTRDRADRSVHGEEFAAFHIVARVLSEPAWLVDRTGRVVAFNPPARALFGTDLVEGVQLSELLSHDRQPIDDWLRMAAGSNQMIPGRFRHAGTSVFVEAAALRGRESTGYVMVRSRRSEIMLHRIVTLEEDRRYLESRSDFDSLTGLPNRSAFDRRWRELCEDGPETEVGVIMIDIDEFKAYNDCYGHGAGDECLRRVARSIAQVANANGAFPARVGGEEFVVISNAYTEDALAQVAERIVEAVADLGIVHDRNPPLNKVTASAGVATGPAGIDGGLRVRDAADAALYQAKFLGKNRVELQSSVTGPG